MDLLNKANRVLIETLQIYIQVAKYLLRFFYNIVHKLYLFLKIKFSSLSFSYKKLPIKKYKKNVNKILKNAFLFKKRFLSKFKRFNYLTIKSVKKYNKAVFIFFKKSRVKLKINTLSTSKKLKFKKDGYIKIRQRVNKTNNKIRYSFVLKIIVFNLVFFCGLMASTIFYYKYIYTLPSYTLLKNYRPNQTTFIYDKNGGLLYKTYVDENRTLIKLSDLHSYTINSIISVEDADFYSHLGISLNSIFRAALANYKNKSVVQGGSTITQQLVKNILLNDEKTIDRKIKEAVLAILIERKYTKDQILETYLNTVSFGGTAYGIEEASQQYFGTSSKKLTLAQSALLAGLPAAPSEYSPYIDEKASKIRQKQVLQTMVDNNYISQTQMDKALEEELNIKYPVTVKNYPHFVDYVYYYLSQKYGERLIQSGGLKVYTTLDPSLTNLSQNIVKNSVEKIKNLNVSNGAALVIKNKTGEVLSMVGSKDFYATDIDGFVNVTTSLRQPGSSIKPFNYSLALQNGLTASTLIDDSPITYKVAGSEPYTPKNYDGKFRGKVTIRRALANSLNIPAVKTLEKNGVENFIKYIKNFGITTWNQDYYGLSLALGSAEVKMTELANAYTVFANDGVYIPINPVLYIENANGEIIDYNSCIFSKSFFAGKKVISKQDICGTRVIPSGNSFVITSILTDFEARKESFGISVLNVPGTAVKTGTTNDLRDNWAFGFNKEYTVATWVGNNDNRPMSRIASGITGASPIWADIIKNITNDQNKINVKDSIPSDVVALPICNLTNTLSCSKCTTGVEYYIKGTEPKTYCRDNSLEEILKKIEEKKKKKN